MTNIIISLSRLFGWNIIFLFFLKKIEKLLMKKSLATRVIFHFSYNSRCKRRHCGEETKKINFLKNGSYSYDAVEDVFIYIKVRRIPIRFLNRIALKICSFATLSSQVTRPSVLMKSLIIQKQYTTVTFKEFWKLKIKIFVFIISRLR